MIPNHDQRVDLKTFDRILADAKEEYAKSKVYSPTVPLSEICEDCNIQYLNL